MRKAKPTCRRTGAKVGEPSACVRCPGYRAERCDVRVSRGCARNDMHGPPAVGPHSNAHLHGHEPARGGQQSTVGQVRSSTQPGAEAHATHSPAQP
eukprot:5355149-Prymnesium_polylepis.1